MRSLIPCNPMDLKSMWSLAGHPHGLDRLLAGPASVKEGGSQLVRMDWSESEDEVRVRAEIPGIASDELEITVSGDVLTLAGEKKRPTEEEERGAYSERLYGSFRRQVKLPYAIATDQVRAESVDAVVTIHLPKSEAERSRRIEVSPTPAP